MVFRMKVNSFPILCVVMFLLTTTSADANNSDDQEPPERKSIIKLNERLTKLVAGWDFKLRSYDVRTEDDYVLKLHRLVKDEAKAKSPLLIMHGILSCSSVYVANRGSAAYYLAERGYDVWIANARGTIFSQRNYKLKPRQKKFWDYSFHEMGKFDLPAIIERIKIETKADRVHYVGYSMGTTAFLVMASLHSNLVRDEIASVTLVAPVACPKHFSKIDNTFKRVFFKTFLKIFGTLFRGDIFTYHKYTALVTYKLCKSKVLGWLCEKLLRFRSRGKDIYDHKGSLEVYPFFPCGASVKSFLHFIQIAEKEIFQQYDYGPTLNKVKYHKTTPLEYNLQSIENQLFLLVGGKDTEADKTDIQWMQARLKNSVFIEKRFEQFDHRDFEYSTHLNVIGEVIQEIIDAYNEKRQPKL